MSGIEHYLEAERLLDEAVVSDYYAADRPSSADHRDVDCEGCGNLAAAAVHAALAATAAQFLPLFHPEHRAEWLRVLDPSSPYIPKETP